MSVTVFDTATQCLEEALSVSLYLTLLHTVSGRYTRPVSSEVQRILFDVLYLILGWSPVKSSRFSLM